MIWEAKTIRPDYVLIYLQGIICVVLAKGQLAAQKLVQADPDAPIVGRIVIARAQEHLGGRIGRGPHQCVGPILQLFTGSQVENLDKTLFIYENVFWLDIPVDYALRVHILNC